MLYQQFYSELGKLLYAVADIDGHISEKEKKSLHDLVRKELKPQAKMKDAYGTDVAYYSEFEFEIMEENVLDPETAFESFIDFIQNHSTAVDEKMIEVTRKVAAKLADAYHHTSKKEKELLIKLNKNLDLIMAQKKK